MCLTINGNSILSLDDDEKCVLWNDGLLPCTCEKLKPYLFVDVSLTGDGEFLSRSKPSIAADGDGDDDDDGGVRSPWISDDAGDEGVMWCISNGSDDDLMWCISDDNGVVIWCISNGDDDFDWMHCISIGDGVTWCLKVGLKPLLDDDNDDVVSDAADNDAIQQSCLNLSNEVTYECWPCDDNKEENDDDTNSSSFFETSGIQRENGLFDMEEE